MIPKVLAYITRAGANGETEVLVFRHRDAPDAGLQVPGGTVDTGETLIDAVRREVAEECGLLDIGEARLIAKSPFFAEWRDEWQQRNIFHAQAPAGLPESWVHIVDAGEEDCGLVFVFTWMPLEQAAEELVWGQGQWLRLIDHTA